MVDFATVVFTDAMYPGLQAGSPEKSDCIMEEENLEPEDDCESLFDDSDMAVLDTTLKSNAGIHN